MRTPRAQQRGFTYIGLLFVVVVIGMMLTVASRVWQTTVKREREAQLLWVGHAYRLAIASYFASGYRYPAKLEDLLADDRFPVPKRHLRKLYPDPMTGKTDWTLVRTADQSGIQGIVSASQEAPIKRDGFELIDQPFTDTDCYCQWKFIYLPYRRAPVGVPGSPQPTPGGGTPTPGSQPGAPGVVVPVTPNPTPTFGSH